MTETLVCVECGAESSSSARHWRAYRADLDEVAIYCPACASREFVESGDSGSVGLSEDVS